MSNDWIGEQARKDLEEDRRQQQRKDEGQQSERRRLEITEQQLPKLWADFGAALTRLIESYNANYGKPVFSIEVNRGPIIIKGVRPNHVLSVFLEVDKTKRLINYKASKVSGNTASGVTLHLPALYLEGDTLTFRYVPDPGKGPLTPDQAAADAMKAIVEA
jgi:hypothetical protein